MELQLSRSAKPQPSDVACLTWPQLRRFAGIRCENGLLLMLLHPPTIQCIGSNRRLIGINEHVNVQPFICFTVVTDCDVDQVLAVADHIHLAMWPSSVRHRQKSGEAPISSIGCNWQSVPRDLSELGRMMLPPVPNEIGHFVWVGSDFVQLGTRRPSALYSVHRDTEQLARRRVAGDATIRWQRNREGLLVSCSPVDPLSRERGIADFPSCWSCPQWHRMHLKDIAVTVIEEASESFGVEPCRQSCYHEPRWLKLASERRDSLRVRS